MAFDFKSILNRIKSNLKNDDNCIEGNFSMDNIQAVSQELAMLYSIEIQPILDNISLDTATGKYLDRKALDFAMERNPALSAHGTINIIGTAGTIIDINSKVQSDELTFTVIVGCIIDASGNGTATVECDITGVVGNISSNKIESFTSLSGIYGVIVSNNAAFSGGVDIESDDAFRQRILEKIRKPITSGNENHYVYWAKQVSGVSDAKCIGCWNGAGTVKVIVFCNDGASSQAVILAVTDFIESQRPIGADVTVVAATEKIVNVSCQLTLDENSETAVVSKQIKQNLTRFLNSESNSDRTKLSYYKVSDILFGIVGVTDIISYTLNGLTTSLQASPDEFIQIGEVTVNA